MFEDIFKAELANLTSDYILIEKSWTEIHSSYNKPGRHYHTLAHLDNLTEQLVPIKGQIKDWQTLVFSVGYHDIIYNVLKKDNEEKSAEFALKKLTQLNLPSASKEKCKQQIIATKYHQSTEDTDTNYFTDADLSILGSDEMSYSNYTKQIRKEYRRFPDILYKPGRKKVLMHFLEFKNIFKTKYFQDKFEKQARINISTELQSLS